MKQICARRFCIGFILIFSIFWSISWCQIDTMYLYDNMGRNDKVFLINMTRDMIKDAQIRMMTIIGIRTRHQNSRAFDIGVVMGYIREKYRQMVEIFRQHRDKFSERSLFYPPSWSWYIRAGYYIIAMQQTHILEVEVDKLVHMLEVIDDESLNPDPRYANRTQTKRRYYRAQDIEIMDKMAAEQDLKSDYREKALLRKLSQPTHHHTSAKRFQRQWPVDANWDLGAYGDMNLYSGH